MGPNTPISVETPGNEPSEFHQVPWPGGVGDCARGIGLVLITHDLASARYVTSRTYVMYAGYVVEHGPTQQLIDDPRHPYTQLLVSCVPNRGGPGGLPAGALGGATRALPQRQGCPFAPRCAHRRSICEEQMPPVTALGEGRSVRCHLYGGPGTTGGTRLSPPPTSGPRAAAAETAAGGPATAGTTEGKQRQ